MLNLVDSSPQMSNNSWNADEFDPSSSAFSQMQQLLRSWEQQQLQEFLTFATGVANLQPNGSMLNPDATPGWLRLAVCLPCCSREPLLTLQHTRFVFSDAPVQPAGPHPSSRTLGYVRVFQ